MTLAEFEQHIGITFTNKALLEQAFIHRSYINENPRSGLSHNERLEFLGDAVLELAVTEFLYAKFPDHNEGDLTSYRSALVNAITLGEVSEGLHINEMMKFSKGEAKDVSRARSSILADAYEALVGAMYLDQGFKTVQSFIVRTVLSKTDEVIRKGLYKDAKSFIQEKSQELLNITPSYKVISEEGPDHDKLFTVAICFGTEEVAQGEGKSKQEAETQAARAGLVKKGWIQG